MKILKIVAIRNEQYTAAFGSDLVGCHGFSLTNAGTSNVRFKLLADTGTIELKPEESITFQSVWAVPFEDNRIEGDFTDAENVLPADRKDIVRVTKYLGRYND